MADHCSICDVRRPQGGTNILILGEMWLEFCEPCGKKEVLQNNQTGEQKPICEVFAETQKEEESA